MTELETPPLSPTDWSGYAAAVASGFAVAMWLANVLIGVAVACALLVVARCGGRIAAALAWAQRTRRTGVGAIAPLVAAVSVAIHADNAWAGAAVFLACGVPIFLTDLVVDAIVTTKGGARD